jgi:hypothetical protein
MKFKVLVLACFSIICLIGLNGVILPGTIAMQAQRMPGDDLVIPSVDEKWGPTKFTHNKHLAYSDCTYCHHTNKGLTLEQFNGGKSERIPLCAECHFRKEGEPKTPKAADGLELWSKEAYHLNCIDCHKGEITRKPKEAGGIKKQGEGPTKCAACHEVKEQ